jgi:hypothetical protein
VAQVVQSMHPSSPAVRENCSLIYGHGLLREVLGAVWTVLCDTKYKAFIPRTAWSYVARPGLIWQLLESPRPHTHDPGARHIKALSYCWLLLGPSSFAPLFSLSFHSL